MHTLHIGTSRAGRFTLPLELVTTSLAILAKKRVGKSYTAAVFAEELMINRQPVVIIDITGAHWGLKSSADGKSEKFPVVIFGGRHADVPLEENAGMVIASAIATLRFSAILDFSLMSKSGMKRFLQAFLEEFYRINVEPIHLICDEADRYCPQQPQGDEIKLVAAMDDIVSRGGIKGIGVSIISQRSAKVNKNIVTQCELLIALRIVHPLDAKTIMEWVEMHATKEQAAEMLKSLPNLPIGTAWFWWPGAPSGDIFERVKVRTRSTFDSGATPKAGESRQQPKAVAQVDVAKLGADIAATVQRAKDNDPRELKAKIARLERDVAEKKAAPLKAVIEKVEVPVFDARDKEKMEEIGILFSEVKERMAHAAKLFDALKSEVAKTQRLPARGPSTISYRPVAPVEIRVRQRPTPILSGASNGESLPKGERAVLIACAQYPEGVERETLTQLTGYKRSSRDAYIQRLREKGFALSAGDKLVATPTGVEVLGADYEPLPTGNALLEYWLARLPEGERRILEALVQARPTPVTADELDQTTGYKRSSRDAYLHRLAARKLVIRNRDGIRASEILFD